MTETYLITGGAGFIGVNLAAHHLAQGRRVIVFDDFSRFGTEPNADWLRGQWGDHVQIIRGDVRAPSRELDSAVAEATTVFHLAAQVAVTLSVNNPRWDFEVNALGTFNLLEAVRQSASRPIVVYASTNKVYGHMADVAVEEQRGRYGYRDLTLGVPESRALDFHSPYGCSKGAGDQYVLDYARIYGLRTVVFRQSCIYGPHQFGIEDQGWLAWFAFRALQQLPVTIFGDGRQVRDVLFMEDLNAAYDAAIARIDRVAGQAFNIGGGPGYTLSLLELLGHLEDKLGRPVAHSFADWRPGDQRVYVSDIRKARALLDWAPRIGVSQGVDHLLAWQRDHLPVLTGTDG